MDEIVVYKYSWLNLSLYPLFSLLFVREQSAAYNNWNVWVKYKLEEKNALWTLHEEIWKKNRFCKLGDAQVYQQ